MQSFAKKLIHKLLRKNPGQNDVGASATSSAPAQRGTRSQQRKKASAKKFFVASPNANSAALLGPAIHGINPELISRNAIRVTHTLQQAGFQAFIVGGAVRDLLLDVAPKDFDIATDATPTEVQQLFRRARLIGRRFQIVHVQFGQELIEVSTFRGRADKIGTPEVAATTAEPYLPPRASQPYPEEGRHERRKRRSDLDDRLHAVDAAGRVLRDNIWGTQHEDAERRDFTVNAMYYDPASQTLHDYHEGFSDIRARVLRMIGDPATRYREDPVRMLRVVRFAAKLGFTIEAGTRAPIVELAELINNVPAARLFDEMLKLLLSGHALACLQQLRAEGLHHGLLPLLDVALEQPHGEKFISLALSRTDERVRAGKTVSPGFLFAALLWQQTQERWQRHLANGELPIPSLHEAIDEVLDVQTRKLAIQRRFVSDMREIWSTQPRLEKRSGRSPLKLLEHPRFRASYDFMLLRCECGELDPAIGQWWRAFIDADPPEREKLLKQNPQNSRPGTKRRRRGKASTAESDDSAQQDTQHDATLAR